MHSIGEAARQSGVTVETIRYYERERIVPPPDRSASGRRLYDPAGIMRLRFVRRCRDLGLSIADIRTLLVFCEEGGMPAATSRRSASVTWTRSAAGSLTCAAWRPRLKP